VLPPPARRPLEPEAAAVDQFDVLGPAQDTPHGFREQDLAALGLSRDAGSGIHRLPKQVRLLLDSLSRVQADAHPHLLVGVLTVVLLQRPLDAHCAGHGLSGRGEGHHEAVAQGLHLVAAVLLDLPAHQLPLGAKYCLRSLVAPAGHQVGGGFNVREEDGDCALRKLVGHNGRPPLRQRTELFFIRRRKSNERYSPPRWIRLTHLNKELRT
jgi:hypothetical protein